MYLSWWTMRPMTCSLLQKLLLWIVVYDVCYCSLQQLHSLAICNNLSSVHWIVCESSVIQQNPIPENIETFSCNYRHTLPSSVHGEMDKNIKRINKHLKFHTWKCKANGKVCKYICALHSNGKLGELQSELVQFHLFIWIWSGFSLDITSRQIRKVV